jgi:hypothetical protein
MGCRAARARAAHRARKTGYRLRRIGDEGRDRPPAGSFGVELVLRCGRRITFRAVSPTDLTIRTHWTCASCGFCRGSGENCR